MVNYGTGRIYKIVSKECGTIRYVGSTTRQLSVRLSSHRYKSLTKPSPFHSWVLNNGGWQSLDIVLVENYPCCNKEELHMRERYWIETLSPQLNKTIPTRTMREYRESNRDAILEQRRQYREVNNDKIIEYRKQHRAKMNEQKNE